VSTEPAISSQPRTTLADRIVLGVILCFMFIGLCLLGWRALAAREHFAAPTSFLVLCFAVGFVVAWGWALFTRWRVKTGRAINPYSMQPAFFAIVTVVALPKAVAGWLAMFHKLSNPALKGAEDQAQAATLIGFVVACGFAFWFKKTGASALVRPPASGNTELTSQKPSSP